MPENSWCDKNTKKELSPPFVVEKDKDYYQSLEEKLILLKNNIKSLNIDEENETNILSTIDSVIEVFSNYYSGDMKNAISIMEEIIKGLTGTFIVTNLSDAMGRFYDSSHSLGNMYLFRARNSNEMRDFSCDDMKHIPFFMRERVPNCRFSMNGIPCLYLGNTSYDCWLELGRPAEHKFHVCTMKLKKDKKILNLTISNGDIFSKDIKSPDFVNYVKVLILKICTSYTVEQEGRSFKSEYIFPQLMTIVCDKLMDGIVYFSKRVSDERFAIPAINIVLFSKYKNGDCEYGEVCKDLIIGNSINYSYFKQTYDSFLNKGSYGVWKPHYSYIANVGNISRQTPYNNTWFAKLDNYLIEELEGKKMTRVELKNKTIFITGVAGFIGSNLAKRLLKDFENLKVVGLDNLNDYYDIRLKEDRLEELEKNDRFTFIKGNLGNKELIMSIFEKYKPNVVVNLGGQAGVRYSIENPDAYVEGNLVGFFNILEGCRYYPVEHLVYASSSSVYGSNKKVPYSTDDMVDNPVSLYAATKKSDELMAHAYSKLYNIPSTGLRFFTVYGPAGRPDMAYFGFTNKLIKGEKIQIFNYGNCKRDFTYIDDIVEGVVRVMQGAPEKKNGEDGLPIPPYSIYNIGNNHPENLLEFVEILQEELIRAGVLPEDYDFEAHKEFVPMQPGDVPITYADTSALERDFGYKPNTSLREGLRKFAEWYKKFYL